MGGHEYDPYDDKFGGLFRFFRFRGGAGTERRSCCEVVCVSYIHTLSVEVMCAEEVKRSNSAG